MPIIPFASKLFFCRVTAPDSPTILDNLDLYIKTKHYNHPFDKFFHIHEIGIKSEKPHYHLLIVCRTTRIEITKWIKNNFNVTGNQQFSVSDKYTPDSYESSLAYMYKGGLNEIYENKVKMNLTEETIEKLKSLYMPNKKSIDYKNDEKFEYYMKLIINNYNCATEKDLKIRLANNTYCEVLKKLFYVIIKDAIKSRKRIMRCNLYDWSFTLTLHLCSFEQQEKLINKTIDETLEKNLNI